MQSSKARNWGIALALLAAAAVTAQAQTSGRPARRQSPGADRGNAVWLTAGGRITFLPDMDVLHEYGIDLQTLRQTAVDDAFPQVNSTFAIERGETSNLIFAVRNDRFSGLIGGDLKTDGEMLLSLASGDLFSIGNFDLHFAPDGSGIGAASVTDRLGTNREAFDIAGGLLQVDTNAGRFEWAGMQVRLNAAWAHEIGVPAAGGLAIGLIFIEAPAVPAPGAVFNPDPSGGSGGPPPGEDGGPDVYGATGPDIVVGDLPDLSRYGDVGGITAFAVGTTSCNYGTVWCNWISGTSEHPVIGQNMYRLKGGRFEHIGQSWLKHGFYALSDAQCFNDCQPTDGTHLGVHCSDTYTAGLNGSQSNLGPRYQVNAATGIFPYPPANPSTPPTIGRRLQVHDTDLDPTQNLGAVYFVEGQYVSHDDATAGNKYNNASYRRIQVTSSGNPPAYNIGFVGGQQTQRQKAAIQAWQDNDPAVAIANMDVTNDGRFILGYKVTDNGNGTWHYEYALFNMNSDRSGQSLTIPIPAGVNVTNIGFHDVDYHSSDGIPNGGTPRNFDGTNWTGTLAGGYLTWATTPYATDTNANALRWGTLYNFRFDADAAPTTSSLTLGLFKPGSPASVVTFTQGPSGPPLTISVQSTYSVANANQLFPYMIVVTNISGVTQTFTVWGDVYTPENALLQRSPVNVVTTSLGPGQSQTWSYSPTCPSNIRTSTSPWTYTGKVGPSLGIVINSASFQFTSSNP